MTRSEAVKLARVEQNIFSIYVYRALLKEVTDYQPVDVKKRKLFSDRERVKSNQKR